MSTDAIVALKQDHKEVAKLFAEFERKSTSERRKKSIVPDVLSKLAVHTAIEDEIFYPAVRKLVPQLKDDLLESSEEHHVVDVLAAELEKLDPDHERYLPKFTVLMENVRHHVKEEEQEWFPVVREHVSRKTLSELGAAMLARRKQL